MSSSDYEDYTDYDDYTLSLLSSLISILIIHIINIELPQKGSPRLTRWTRPGTAEARDRSASLAGVDWIGTPSLRLVPRRPPGALQTQLKAVGEKIFKKAF